MAADRLTALDASFLHLEDESSHMHVAGVSIFAGEPPTYEELLGAHRGAALAGAALPPEAAFRAVRPGAAGVGRRPPLQPRVPRALHRAATARQRGAAEEPRQPRVRAATRPHEAAVGDLARRGPRPRPAANGGDSEESQPARAVRAPFQDAPRARGRRRRRRHHRGAVRHRCRPRDTARPGHALAATPRADVDAVARRRADRARDPAGRGRALRAGGVPGAAQDRPPRPRERRRPWERSPRPAWAPHPRS